MHRGRTPHCSAAFRALNFKGTAQESLKQLRGKEQAAPRYSAVFAGNRKQGFKGTQTMNRTKFVINFAWWFLFVTIPTD